MIAEVARLYIPEGALVADVTWGKGNFWPLTNLERFALLGSDIEPSLLATAAQVGAQQSWLVPVARPHFVCCDFRALPYRDRSLDVVVLDPPYLHRPGGWLAENNSYNNQTTVGMNHQDILRELYCRGILEAARVLKSGGQLWVKCKDEIEGGRQCLSREQIPLAAARCGFVEQEMFLYNSEVGIGLVQSPLYTHQRHAKKSHSYLFVFVLAQALSLPPRGRPRKGSVVTTLKGDRGTVYLAARLMRDYPQTYAQYMAGELPSVHAAARQAGLVTTKVARTTRGE